MRRLCQNLKTCKANRFRLIEKAFRVSALWFHSDVHAGQRSATDIWEEEIEFSQSFKVVHFASEDILSSMAGKVIFRKQQLTWRQYFITLFRNRFPRNNQTIKVFQKNKLTLNRNSPLWCKISMCNSKFKTFQKNHFIWRTVLNWKVKCWSQSYSLC